MTHPTNTAANGRRLVAALEAWAAAPDNAAVLDACAAVKASHDPADRVSRAEVELADAIETAVEIGDSAVAWEAVSDAMRKSKAVMHQATRQAFEHMLDTLTLDNVTAEKVDALADIGRQLNAS